MVVQERVIFGECNLKVIWWSKTWEGSRGRRFNNGGGRRRVCQGWTWVRLLLYHIGSWIYIIINRDLKIILASHNLFLGAYSCIYMFSKDYISLNMYIIFHLNLDVINLNQIIVYLVLACQIMVYKKKVVTEI